MAKRNNDKNKKDKGVLDYSLRDFADSVQAIYAISAIFVGLIFASAYFYFEYKQTIRKLNEVTCKLNKQKAVYEYKNTQLALSIEQTSNLKIHSALSKIIYALEKLENNPSDVNIVAKHSIEVLEKQQNFLSEENKEKNSSIEKYGDDALRAELAMDECEGDKK
ncbi:hypothetical protein [Pleionea sp. CnH1-48]|uniref:hypothetical protein n=1 Tax=Pleionea sp. CnH1-48 TaxID=2954494 RepID=UPI0020974E39|nr:hypothetical protein [Pleionea sp. CnH1-48]MCO7223041.1 hypothetical protein [Pleionea sp. CnH1-48]